jgi:serine/threonine protein kinase
MPPPTTPPSPTATTFALAVERSGLLPLGRVAEVRADPRSPQAIAADLIAAGDLTVFQAQKLLAGQWYGLILGPYVILAPLGRGGMGIVYLARENRPADTTTARPLIALKILPPRKALAEPRTTARFLREMNLGYQVPAHPHIARVLHTGQAGDVNYIAMEYVPGDTLKAVVAEAGPLTVAHAARLFAQIADALSVAHAAGWIHRDLKPSNIMVTLASTAKLLDFGLAIRTGEVLPEDPAILGGPGYTLGTMDYIAPEQANNATAVTPASDLYALGCSLYFALAGCPPFPGGTAAEKIRRHRSDSPPPIRRLNPAVPIELARVVTRLMAKQPSDRYASADELRRDLLGWAKETPIAIPVAEPIRRPTAVIHVTDDDLWEWEDTVEEPPGRGKIIRRIESPWPPGRSPLAVVVIGLAMLTVVGLAAALGYLFRLYRG